MVQEVSGRVGCAETGPRPTGQAPAGLDASRFDPARVAEAVSLVEATLLEPIVRKAADDFYDQLYSTVENYLKENLDYNITQHISMLERENKRLSAELYAVDQIVGPPWITPADRIERLRAMDKHGAELLSLRYEVQFAKPSPLAGDGL